MISWMWIILYFCESLSRKGNDSCILIAFYRFKRQRHCWHIQNISLFKKSNTIKCLAKISFKSVFLFQVFVEKYRMKWQLRNTHSKCHLCSKDYYFKMNSIQWINRPIIMMIIFASSLTYLHGQDIADENSRALKDHLEDGGSKWNCDHQNQAFW